jgi:hypothetical protein
MKCCREPRQAWVASEALSQRRRMEALHAYRTVVHANIGPQLNVRQTEELEMSLNSSAGQTAAKFAAILMLVILIPGELAAQGEPVKTASHLPVALWFIGAGVLGVVLAYGIMRNRQRTRVETGNQRSL